MPRASKASVPPAELRKIATHASCDPRTVRSYLDGRNVIASMRATIERSLRALGRVDLVRGTAPAERTA